MTAPTTERPNEHWLVALSGLEQSRALADLREVLVRGLRAVMKGRPECVPEASIEDFAQEALMKILGNLDSYRGRVVSPPGRRR